MTELKANDGYVFALKDRTAVYDDIIYLSDIDSKDRYIQVTKDEAEEIKAEIEAPD